jgi:hypothetical protein
VIDHLPAAANPNIPYPTADLAIGPDGVPEVAYAYAGSAFLPNPTPPTFARFAGTGWDGETVQTGAQTAIAASDLSPGLSLVVDSAGSTLLTYSSTGSVLLATRQSRNDWSLASVGTAGLLTRVTSLAVDASGDPVVAFDSGVGLSVSRRSSGIWSTLGKFFGSDPVMLLDSGGLPHLMYSDGSGSRDFVVRSATGWDAVYCGQFCAPAQRAILDPQDRLHYMSGGDHVVWTGTMSTMRSIESGLPIGEYALAADANGAIHFAYRTTQNSAAPPRVRYAYDDGNTIRVEDVTTTGDPGWGVRIAIGPSGSPVIVYYDAAAGDLVSAFKN